MVKRFYESNKGRKGYITLAVFILSMNLYAQPKDITIPNGLYYGKNHGFFPQTIIYAYIYENTAYVEGFYPLKGEKFTTFKDTLYYSTNQNMYINKKSRIYFKKKNIFFTRDDDIWIFEVKDTKLIYSPEKVEDYERIKHVSKPYESNKHN